MDFYTFTTVREVCKRSGGLDVPSDDPDQFYRLAFTDAVKMGSGQFYGQLHNEREWEKACRPYVSVKESASAPLARSNWANSA